MAKLSARGRRELLRVERERSTPDGELTIWERTTLAVMSDGGVLSKLDVRFRPDAYEPGGRLHSYGWKRKGKLAAGKTVETFRQAYERAGWRIVERDLRNIGVRSAFV